MIYRERERGIYIYIYIYIYTDNIGVTGVSYVGY